MCGVGDYVFDVVGVVRGVDVCVVLFVGLVFYVCDVDGDIVLMFFGGVVDLVECFCFV